jgi:hypothetical protein
MRYYALRGSCSLAADWRGYAVRGLAGQGSFARVGSPSVRRREPGDLG